MVIVRESRNISGALQGPPLSGVAKLMPIDEKLTVRKAIDGDMDAFISLFEKYKGFVWNVAYRMTYDFDEAEDLAQEVFIAVWKSLRNFRGDSSFSTWIYRITVNRSLNRINRKREHAEFNEEAYMARNPGTGIDQLEAERTLAVLFSRLNPDRRVALILCELEGLSYGEIAKATDVNIGTVRSRIARARQELKKIAADI